MYPFRKSLNDIVIDRESSHMERGPDGVTRQITKTFRQKVGVRSVDSGKRFAHYAIDGIVMITAVMVPTQFLVLIHPAFALFTPIGIFGACPLYYILCEHYMGQTVGKMVTGSVVVNQYAEKPELQQALLRTLIRIVPFEALSCAESPSRGWHDKWTDTWVVSKAEAARLKDIVDKHNWDLTGQKPDTNS